MIYISAPHVYLNNSTAQTTEKWCQQQLLNNILEHQF